MKQILRYFLLLTLLAFTAETMMAQELKTRQIHKVKRKETIFGIARDYGITVRELLEANPEMNEPTYPGLKRGDYIIVPKPAASVEAAQQAEAQQAAKPAAVTDMRHREIRVGVMLPLHDVNGDGRRMVEYYRGVLMACDSLRYNGISVDVHAWNVAEDADITRFLNEEGAAQCDLIIGPLYSKQVKPLSDFATQNDIRVLIPFSINTPELFTNRNIFQVYQNPNDFN